MKRYTGRLVMGATAVPMALVLAGNASAQLVNYGNFPGAGTDPDILNVTEDSSTDPTPLFGAPTRVGNSLLFFPTNYSSLSTGAGGADTTAGTLSMMVQAKAGFFLETITVKEFGDWQLTGAGTAATSVTASGAMFITDLVPGINGVFNDTIATSPLMPVELPPPSSGIWTGMTQIDLTGLGITMIQLQFNNVLSSTSEAGTTAFIQKKVVNGPAITIEVPTPGVGALLGLGGLVALRRRRR